MKSGWLRVTGGTIFVIAWAYGICVTPTPARADEQALHLAAAPEDFARFGLGKEIQVREDGRRTPQSPVYFEWWYFDGLLDDGTVVVVWFGDNWLYGSHKRAVDIELTSPGKATRRIMRTFDEPGTFASDHAGHRDWAAPVRRRSEVLHHPRRRQRDGRPRMRPRPPPQGPVLSPRHRPHRRGRQGLRVVRGRARRAPSPAP